MIRLRMSAHDAHYGGDLVDGARMLGLFGDVATELLIQLDGDEGLFVAYDCVEFNAYKVIRGNIDPANPSAAEVLDEPILVTYARGTCVTPKEKQRWKN